MPICNYCSEDKSQSNFYFRKNENRFEKTCKKCRNKKSWKNIKEGKTKKREPFNFKCLKCNIQKSADDFYLKDKKSNRYDSTCKSCRKYNANKINQTNSNKKDPQQSSNYYEEYKKNRRKWYQDNKEIICEKHKKWREDNHEKVKEKAKKWYHNNKEKVKERRQKCVKCKKITPNFNLPGEKTAEYCSECKSDDMINVKIKKCAANTEQGSICTQWANKKYRDYCTTCFKHFFPDDPLTSKIHCNTNEEKVKKFINDNFDGFVHDEPLWTGHCDCSVRRRIDHRKLFGNTLLCIETDENQHKSYNEQDEKDRYDDLYNAYSGKWIFIRFNPDHYKDQNGKKKNPRIETRLKALQVEINKQITRIEKEENKELVEIVYMYYDEK